MSDRQTSGQTSVRNANVNFGVMPEQIIKELQGATSSSSGSDFIVIQRVRQGEEPKVWSTGDPEQTKNLFRNGYTALAYNDELEPA